MPGNVSGKPASFPKPRPSALLTSGSGEMPWPALIPLGHHQGKPAIPLMRPVMLIGARHNAHLHLLSRSISKAHALLISSEGRVYLRDLASRTHTYVNGQEIREADLVNGDMIKIGSFVFRFQSAAGMKQKATPDTTPAGQLDIDGGQFPILVDERVMLIGRRAACEISLMEESCSTAHAVIFSMGGKRYVRDLGSRTGTFVNGTQVRQQEIAFGDTVHIGDTDIRYQATAESGLAHAAEELEDLVGTAPLIPEAVSEPEPPAAPAEPPLDLDFDLGAVESDLHPAHPAEPPESHDLDPIPLASDDHALSITPVEPEPRMLVGNNLLGEKLSSSATGAGMQDAAREAIDLAATETSPSSIEITWDTPIPLEAEVSNSSTSQTPATPAEASTPPPLVAEASTLIVPELEAPSPAHVEEPPKDDLAIDLAIAPQEELIPLSEDELLSEMANDVSSAEAPMPLPMDSEPVEPVADEPAPVVEERVHELQVKEVIVATPAEPESGNKKDVTDELAVEEPTTVTPPPSISEDEFLDELEIAPIEDEPAFEAVSDEIKSPPVEEEAPPHIEPELQSSEPIIDPEPASENDLLEELPTEAAQFIPPIETTPSESIPDAQTLTFDPGALSVEPASTVTEPPESQPGAEAAELFFGKESLDEIAPPLDAEADESILRIAPEPEPIAEEPSVVEVIEPTEPTVESALPLDQVAPESSTPSQTADSLTIVDPSLSDTTFGRQVSEFVADSPDPVLIEEPAPSSPVKVEEHDEASPEPDLPMVDALDFGNEAEEPPQPTTQVEMPPELAIAPEAMVEDISPIFVPVEPQPLLPIEPPVEVSQTPIEPALDFDVAAITPQESTDSFEEAFDLEMLPQDPVTADPVALEDLPLDEFPEELPDPTPESFDLPVEQTMFAPPEALSEPDVHSTISETPAFPLIPGMPLNLAEMSVLPDFVGGLPLVLDELPAPPPTFGRVKVSFDGEFGLQSIIDEPLTRLPKEPGPFDNLQIDINNPVPDAPALSLSPLLEEPYSDDSEALAEPSEAPEPVAEIEPHVQEPVIEPIIFEPEIEDAPPAELEELLDHEPTVEAAAEPPKPFADVRLPPRPRMDQPAETEQEAPSVAGFEGLTAPFAAGSADVFSQGLSADLSKDPIFGSAVKPLPKEPEIPSRKNADAPKFVRKSRRTLITPPAEDVEILAGNLADDLGAPALADLPPPSEEAAVEAGDAVLSIPHEPTAHERLGRRRDGARIAVLLVVMVLLMIAASFFIYTFLKQQIHFTGTINFENFGKLTVAEQRSLQESQKSLLVSERARLTALNKFQVAAGNASPGFLGSQEDFGRNEVRAQWDKGTLVYHYDEGTDKALDYARVKAVLDAVVVLDGELIRNADETKKQIENMRANLDQKTRDLSALEARRTDANERMQNEPARDQLEALRADASAAETAYEKARKTAEQAGDEKNRLETSMPKTAAVHSSGADSEPARDTQLDELSQSLDDMKSHLATVRANFAEHAEQARKRLDSAIEQLQQSTTTAADLMKDNPELSAFVAEAQKTQQTAQKLAADLLDRQQKSYERLLEDKRLLEDHLAQRRKELWDSDAQIKRMKDDRDMAERGYNAAKGQGYDKQADEIQKQLESSLAAIEKRKLELEGDPTLSMLTDMLARCTLDISATTRQIEADRKQADALADQAQKSFARLAPAVEKLPESQRDLARQMSEKMQAVTNARKAAADAVAAKDDDRNTVLAELEHQIEAKTQMVEQRKKAVESLNSQQLPARDLEQRQAAVEQKRVAYEAAVKAKAIAEQDWIAKEARLTEARSQATSAARARAEYDKLTADAFNLRDKELPQLRQSLQQAEQNALTMSYPSEPRIAAPIAGEDRRLTYAALAIAGIAIVFSLLIIFAGTRHGSHDLPVPKPMVASSVEPLSGYGLRQPTRA